MSSLANKPRPPKPPRLHKTKSVPNGSPEHASLGSSDSAESNKHISSTSSAIAPPISPSSSAVPPPTPPFKPIGKPALNSSKAAATTNLVKALKLAKEKEQNQKNHATGPDGNKDEDDAFLVVDHDLLTKSHRTSSLIEEPRINGTVSETGVRRQAPSQPKAIPRLPSHREEEEETSVTSSTDSSTKKPLLPPVKRAPSPQRPPPPSRPLSRSMSNGTPPVLKSLTPPKSWLQRGQSHDAEGVWRKNAELNQHLVSEKEAGPMATPISPLSVSSGVPEDEGNLSSPNFTDSRQTTPSCITCSESVLDELIDERGHETPPSHDETDSGATRPSSHSTTKPARPLLPPRPIAAGVNQPKSRVKDDNWWVQQQKQLSLSPPTSPYKPTLTSIPYRSHPILNVPEKRQSSTEMLLKDKSKPIIGPSGEYYPPAVRSVTPELMPSEATVEGERENQDAVSVPKVPKRFEKYRRSNSFSGAADRKVRPVSMVTDLGGKREILKKSQAISESTIEEKPKKLLTRSNHHMSVKVSSPRHQKKGGWGGIFKSRQKIEIPEEASAEETVPSGESSEDETGGTIKRMPKDTSLRRSYDRTSSVDDYEPEYHQLFQYVFVMGLEEDPSTKKLKTHITYQFPPPSSEIEKDDVMILKSLDQFCFPDIQQWKPVVRYNSESYSFVLTNIDASRRFGYCRRLLPDGKDPRLPEVYCIISPLGCFDLYAKILDIVEQRRTVSQVAVFTFLKSIIANPFPAPGRSVSIRMLPAKGGDLETIKLTRPHDSRLEHVDFAELYNSLGPKKLVQVFSSLLMERRVILAAQRLSTLSSCCHALLALLYPFEWQHTFIPVLPNELIDFCGSPLPYIIGINPSLIKQLDHLDIEMEEALIVDLDKRKFVKKFDDESSILPSKLSQYLNHMLEATLIKNEYSRSNRRGQSRADEIIVNAFMTVFAYLFGEYKQFLITMDTSTGVKELQKKEFVASFHSKSTRRFLEAFLRTQMFDKWIEERESPLKLEAVTQGVFEMKLPELREKTQEIEIFSTKKRFWQRKKLKD